MLSTGTYLYISTFSFHVDNVVPSHQDNVAKRVDSGGVPEHLSHLQGYRPSKLRPL